MGYFYENKELRYTYRTLEKITNKVRAYVPSLADYQKLGHSKEESKRHREAKVEQDTMILVTLGAALKDCLRVNVDQKVLTSFIDDIVNGKIEIDCGLTEVSNDENGN